MNRKLSEVAQKIKAAKELQATLDNFIARNRGGSENLMGKERKQNGFGNRSL